LDKESFKKFVGYIKHKLYSDQKWLERGVVAIYEQQTDSEKRVDISLEHNKMGFSGYDATIMSTYAKWIITGGHLTGHHYFKVRAKMMKYATQLAKLAVAKREKKQERYFRNNGLENPQQTELGLEDNRGNC
jgi:hypothetical protein